MAIAIQVRIPQIQGDDIVTQLAGTLPGGQLFSATLRSDASNLLPWMSAATWVTLDFCLLSQFVYGIDRTIPRRPNSVDGWSREIDVSFPVYELRQWQGQKAKWEEILCFLTGDYWKVRFYKNTLEIPELAIEEKYQRDFSAVQLFSGGLDSLVGAIDKLELDARPVLFVSHYDGNMHGPKKDQGQLAPELEDKYGDRFVRLPSLHVNISQTALSTRETTSRSRSILFLGLALLLADNKTNRIEVPENGIVSVNYPLSPSRRSACSTRTTHPFFLHHIEELWQSLGIETVIHTPYWNKTKREVVRECQNQAFLKRLIPLSNSCGKRGHRAHWDDTGTHCGICMPCFYRRASLRGRNDNTEYGNSIADFVNSRTEKWQDFGALLEFLRREITDEEIKREIIANGLQNVHRLHDYIALIRRSRDEVRRWVIASGNANVRNQLQ